MPSNNFVYRGTKKIISTMEDVENKSSILCGSFKTMFGNIGTTYHLWRHEKFDDAQALRTMWISNQASNFIDYSKYYTGDHEFRTQFLPFLRKIQGLMFIYTLKQSFLTFMFNQHFSADATKCTKALI
jgi:hypothetical protein